MFTESKNCQIHVWRISLTLHLIHSNTFSYISKELLKYKSWKTNWKWILLWHVKFFWHISKWWKKNLPVPNKVMETLMRTASLLLHIFITFRSNLLLTSRANSSNKSTLAIYTKSCGIKYHRREQELYKFCWYQR